MSTRPELPPTAGEEADADKIAGFFDHVFKQDNPYRVDRRRTWNRARLYHRSRQWIEPEARDSTNPNWVAIQTELNGIPMPVQNELFPIVTRESALLVGVGSRPYVRPDDDDPRVEEATKVAKDVLNDRCEEESWLEQQQDGSFHLALYGTWFQASWWDIDFTKTTRVPVTTAVRCPQCNFVLADPEIGEEQAIAILSSRPEAVQVEDTPSANSLIDPVRKYTVTHCPVCETHEEDGLVPAEIPALEPSPEAVTSTDGEPPEAALDPAAGPSSPGLSDFAAEESLGEPALEEPDPFAPELPPASLGPALVPGKVQAPGAPPLEPYNVGEEECKTEEDFVGRPLGEDVAMGNTASEVISVFDAMPDPASQGVDSRPDQWQEFAWERPRHLDWLANHYENGCEVKAQESTIVYENHPILSNVDGGITIANGPQVFENHALWRCYVRKPKRVKNADTGEYEMDRGRYVVMANRTLLLDADLMIESTTNPGELIPRIHIDWVQWEKADREAFGIGMCEIAFSKQDSINTQLSQVMDARHRVGSPKWLVDKGIVLDYQGGANSGYTSDFLFMTKTSENVPDPTPFGDKLFNSDVWREHQNDVEAIQRVLMTREIESGEPPKSVDAYSALLLLAQKAAEGRKPRLERIRAMKKRLYKHKLQLIHEFYREKRYYHVRGKNDKWAVRNFIGTDLLGQTNVLLEDEPIVDTGIAKRQGVEQGIKMGTITIDSQATKRKVNRILEISEDINEGPNLQVDMAEDEAIQWLDAAVDPVIDQDGDDHQIHWDVHKVDLCRDDWRELKELCGWNKVKLLLWGWKDTLDMIQASEAAFKLQPPIPPQPTMQLRDPLAFQAAGQKYENDLRIQAEIAAMPKPIELRILHVWQPLLQGYEPPPPAVDDERTNKTTLTPEEALMKVLRLEAHAAGHRYLAQVQAQAAAAGAMQPAAPGGMENAQGNIPRPGEAVAPAPGAGATSAAA